MDKLIEVKFDYVACLSSMYHDILEDRWPSQYMIDAAIGYAAVLGLPGAEVDLIQSTLMG